MADMSNRPLMMSSARFVDQVRQGYEAGVRYCFILGSGASYTSGIKLGTELIKEWRDYLLDRELKHDGYIADCAAEYSGWSYDEDVAPLFCDDYHIKSEDYFKFYDLRFAGTPVVAYSYLQKLMESATASTGYHALAVLLADTDNRLVITTNFDSLIEDTLSLYNAKKPLVVGHESLAPFMESLENRDRTIIAKVHRDLLLHPQNRDEEMKKLDERWEQALTGVLSSCVPIIIGYAGGDHTLMGLLEKMKLGTVYWCTIDAEDDVDERIKQFLRGQGYGRLVSITGFDEIMRELLTAFSGMTEFKDPDVWMSMRIARSKIEHENRLEKSFEVMTSVKADTHKKLDDKNTSSCRANRDINTITDTISNDMDRLFKPYEKDDINTKHIIDRAKAIWASVKGTLAFENEQYTEAAANFTVAKCLEPGKAEYYHSLGITLHAIGRNKEALKEMREAVRYEPGNAHYHHQYGVILLTMGNLEDALAECNTAVRLEPDSAHYHHQRGIILSKMKRYDEALEECDKAVHLEPDSAYYHLQRGVALNGMGYHEEALAECDISVRLEPNNADYHHQRGVTLFAIGRNEEALSEFDKALNLKPCQAKYHFSRGVALHTMQCYREAIVEKSIALNYEPNNAQYHYSRSITLVAMNHYTEALAECSRAIYLEPENAEYHFSHGVVLYILGHRKEALSDFMDAGRLDSKGILLSQHRTIIKNEHLTYMLNDLMNTTFKEQNSLRLQQRHNPPRFMEDNLYESFEDAIMPKDSVEFFIGSKSTCSSELPFVMSKISDIRLYPKIIERRDFRSLDLYSTCSYTREVSANVSIDVRMLLHHQRLDFYLYNLASRDKGILARRDIYTSPENALYHYCIGAALHVIERYKDALAEINEAIRLEPGNAQYHHACGVTFRKMGRLDDSLEEINHAIEIDPKLAIAHRSKVLTLRAMAARTKPSRRKL